RCGDTSLHDQTVFDGLHDDVGHNGVLGRAYTRAYVWNFTSSRGTSPEEAALFVHSQVISSGSRQYPASGAQRERNSNNNVVSANPHTQVDRFLAELGRRLDFLDSYGHLKLDHSIDRAYATLHAVRDSCSHVSDEVIGAGRRRARVLVETLEERYKGALATKDTLEQKVQEGVRLMESTLTDFESRAYAVRDSGIGTAASDFIDESWRRVDEGIERAKEVVDEGIEKAQRAKETMKENIEYAIKCAREQGLIKYDDLPDPWR
ncbi:inc metabolism membrane protein, partial [Cryomyces antarcticus]